MGQIGEKLAAALGVSEEMQGAADPAKAQENPTQPTDGVKEQEPAEPAGSQEANQHEEGGNPAQDAQTLEQRRINAARRREAEKQAAIDAALKAEREKNAAERDNFVKNLGMKNTYTGEPITTEAEFQAFQTQYRRDNADKALESGKLTRDAMNQVIDDNPTMQAMAKFLKDQQQEEPQKGKEESAATTTENEPAATEAEEAQMAGEIAEIQKIMPEYAGMKPQEVINAIMKNPELAPTFENAVMKEEKTFVEAFQDAYKLANFDKAVSQQAQGAAEAKARMERGKQHLTPDGSTRGAGAPSVPPNQLKWAKLFNPNASEADIQAAYARDQRNVTRY